MSIYDANVIGYSIYNLNYSCAEFTVATTCPQKPWRRRRQRSAGVVTIPQSGTSSKFTLLCEADDNEVDTVKSAHLR